MDANSNQISKAVNCSEKKGEEILEAIAFGPESTSDVAPAGLGLFTGVESRLPAEDAGTISDPSKDADAEGVPPALGFTTTGGLTT